MGSSGGSGGNAGGVGSSQQVQKALQAAGLPADGALVGLVMDYLRGQQVGFRLEVWAVVLGFVRRDWNCGLVR